MASKDCSSNEQYVESSGTCPPPPPEADKVWTLQ